MTISTSASQIIVAGNNSTTAFNFSFIGDAASDIFVSYMDASGNLTPLTSSQYSITLTPATNNQLWGIGGVVTYPLTGSPIATGTYLFIQRVLPLTQLISTQNQGNVYPRVTEQALDILEMQIQQVAARTGQLRGTWISGLTYAYGDFVLDGINGNNTGNYYLCLQSNIASVWITDLAAGDWALAINVQTIVTAAGAGAAASASAAAVSATSAAGSATIATTQAGIATTQANNSAASALAAAGTLFGSSTTSNTVGAGAKTFTTQAGLAINPTGGGFLTIANSTSPSNYLHGQVTSYSGTTLIINVLDTGGTGTFSAWNISPSGPQGSSGGGTGTVASGVANQLAYYASSGTTVSGDANATVSFGGLTLGASTVQGSLTLNGATSGTASIVPASVAGTGTTLTLPAVTDTLVSRTSTDTLSNKTLAATTIATTQTAGDNSTKIATTAFVAAAVGTTTAIKAIRRQVFISSGTYTPDANLIEADIQIEGGGAGGAQGTAQNYGGGGGGAGEYAIGLFSVATIAGPKTVTIGAAGGVATAGGTTSVGSLITAFGGGAGSTGTASAGGIGGTGGTGGTGGDYRVQGGDGETGGSGASGSTFFSGGSGGTSFFGGGGRGGTAGGAGQSGKAYGSGGGGGGANASTGAGAVGKAGAVFIIEYCSA